MLRADPEALEEKANVFDAGKDFEDDAAEVKEFLKDEKLFGIWDIYIRYWEMDGFTHERVLYTSPLNPIFSFTLTKQS